MPARLHGARAVPYAQELSISSNSQVNVSGDAALRPSVPGFRTSTIFLADLTDPEGGRRHCHDPSDAEAEGRAHGVPSRR